jgi:hypothetical protein
MGQTQKTQMPRSVDIAMPVFGLSNRPLSSWLNLQFDGSDQATDRQRLQACNGIALFGNLINAFIKKKKNHCIPSI